MNLLLIAIACGVVALLYGILTSQQVLAAPPGNQRMIEVAGAIQEGACGLSAPPVHDDHRRRRRRRRAGLLFPRRASAPSAFVIGAILSGATGFIGMNISVRANVRTAEAARTSLQKGLTIAFRAGAITGMLVAGLALLAISVSLLVPDRPRRLCAQRPRGRHRADRAGARRLAGFDLRPSRRRHLHQGRRRRRRPGRQGRGRNSRGRSPQPGGDRRQRRRQCRRLRRHGRRSVRNLCRHRRHHHGARSRCWSAPAPQLLPLMSLPLLIGGVCIITSIIGTYMVRLGAKELDHGRALQGLLDRDGPRRPGDLRRRLVRARGDLDQIDHDDRRHSASRRSTCSGPASSASPSPR